MPPVPPDEPLYDRIGGTYTRTRRTEPRIAEQLWRALGDARTVLNVGAGTGSYEPSDRYVLAVEPSARMRAQRPPGAAPCLVDTAPSLPFDDLAFDAAMAVHTVHHWEDPVAGLLELRDIQQEAGFGRVAERVRVARAAVEQAFDVGLAGRFDGDGRGCCGAGACCGHAPSVGGRCFARVSPVFGGFPAAVRYRGGVGSGHRALHGWVCESVGPVSRRSVSDSHRM